MNDNFNAPPKLDTEDFTFLSEILADCLDARYLAATSKKPPAYL